MVKIALVEDEKETSELIKSLIVKFSIQEEEEISTDIFNNAEDFLKSFDNSFDLVLMDIELPGIDGMTAVKELRKISDVMVIFVTNLAQYAVNGYSVNAFDFIVKPLNYYHLNLKLKRAFLGLKNKKGKYIVVNSHNGTKVIYTDKLKYVEVNKHVVIYHMIDEDFIASGTLKKVFETLRDLPFALCNQCYLVNLNFVRGINK